MSTEHEQWARHLAVTGDWDFGVDIAVTANLHHLKLSAPQGKIPRQNSVWRHVCRLIGAYHLHALSHQYDYPTEIQ